MIKMFIILLTQLMFCNAYSNTTDDTVILEILSFVTESEKLENRVISHRKSIEAALKKDIKNKSKLKGDYEKSQTIHSNLIKEYSNVIKDLKQMSKSKKHSKETSKLLSSGSSLLSARLERLKLSLASLKKSMN